MTALCLLKGFAYEYMKETLAHPDSASRVFLNQTLGVIAFGFAGTLYWQAFYHEKLVTFNTNTNKVEKHHWVDKERLWDMGILALLGIHLFWQSYASFFKNASGQRFNAAEWLAHCEGWKIPLLYLFTAAMCLALRTQYHNMLHAKAEYNKVRTKMSHATAPVVLAYHVSCVLVVKRVIMLAMALTEFFDTQVAQCCFDSKIRGL